MMQWLNQHIQAIKLVLARMHRHLLATLMMCCVMGVTLCLPGILYVIVDNLDRLSRDVSGEPQISLFLQLDIKPEAVTALGEQLKKHTGIKNYRFVSKDAAWARLQENAGATGVAGSLEKNPLPDAFFVQPKGMEPAAVESLQKEMRQWSGVELAQVDTNWVKRLYAILELGKKAVLVLAALLGFALIAIIGNTIRLQILSQREEIEVSKLMGATDGFIRRPFLYAGALYGLGGGLAAWMLLVCVILLFNYSVADIAALYASNFRLGLPLLQTNLAIIAGAVGLGWIGSYIAVGRSLAQFKLK